jgi:hypothetical protein
MLEAQPGAVGAHLAGVVEFAHRPIGHGVDKFRDHRLDAVLGREVHLPIVIGPVIDAGRGFDRSPHEPVAEQVHAVLGGDPVVAFPVRARRIGLAEIHRAERKLQCWTEAYPWSPIS